MENFVTNHGRGVPLTILACRCCCGVRRIKGWGGTHQTIARKNVFKDSVYNPCAGVGFSVVASLYERTGIGFPNRARTRGCVFSPAGPGYLKGCPVYIWHQSLVIALPEYPREEMKFKMDFSHKFKK